MVIDLYSMFLWLGGAVFCSMYVFSLLDAISDMRKEKGIREFQI